MKTYKGFREGYAATVRVDGSPLNPRLDLRNHSPSGFEWGYPGSGPAQLALAILADHLRDHDEAIRLYQEFKRAVVANLDYEGWTLTTEQVERAVQEIKTADSIDSLTP